MALTNTEMLVKIISTNKFIPARFSAYTIGFIILIRPEYRDDIGLIEHEKVHVHQFWRTLGLNGLFYWLSKRKRLEYEVEAFRKQLEYAEEPSTSRKLFAVYLASNYKLDISKEEAIILLE
jgi:hypothetical protein